MSEATINDGTMCPVRTVGKPGILMSQTCEDWTWLPSGKLIWSGLVATRLLTTSTPSIMKMDVAPVSAIAWSCAIVTAFRACANVVVVAEQSMGGHVETFDATMVSSSAPSSKGEERIWVGSEVVAETKSLNLCAFELHSAPNRQVFRRVGKTVLCIPLVHGSYPLAMNCCAFSRVKAD